VSELQERGDVKVLHKNWENQISGTFMRKEWKMRASVKGNSAAQYCRDATSRTCY